ncbi:hypothetical protein QBC37DRAFT_420477 [Rhypophila decipiens]|uniref:Uncharacterized protein n=1 Tax=Rhypophila decipiens TaxID=261697 RepID=A0AAN6YA60_9PEZI|nr:hypothetical protein QBC37DRAFT_420477 [Rhypophila decipiens]
MLRVRVSPLAVSFFLHFCLFPFFLTSSIDTSFSPSPSISLIILAPFTANPGIPYSIIYYGP